MADIRSAVERISIYLHKFAYQIQGGSGGIFSGFVIGAWSYCAFLFIYWATRGGGDDGSGSKW
jgi:hypothetical protein